MLNLILILVAPVIGGALLHRMWTTRPARRKNAGTAVGQIPLSMRRRRTMAVRREVAHG